MRFMVTLKEPVVNAYKKENQNKMDEKTLHKISYGLFIISSKNKDKINGQIANVLFQVTSTPPQVSISINKENLTYK